MLAGCLGGGLSGFVSHLLFSFLRFGGGGWRVVAGLLGEADDDVGRAAAAAPTEEQRSGMAGPRTGPCGSAFGHLGRWSSVLC